jgi:hypothetical protein
VDTAICAKPGEILAGQLLYGDSIHRTYFCADLSGSVGDCRGQHAICPAKKSTTLPATREAGLVQIAKAVIEAR